MKTRIVALADYTNITKTNTLNILGIFSKLFAPNAPVVHPQMQVVAQFEFEHDELGEKHVKVVLMDIDGNEVLSLEGPMLVPGNNTPDPVIVNQVIQLHNVVFPKFGHYEFAFEIDGKPLDVRLPIELSPMPQGI